jgi:prolyl-tRNA synthetase
VRAGYIRRVGAGNVACLPLARRALRKIVQIVREEMDASGGQEFHFAPGHPVQLARELRSSKQLPQIWYQFQTGLESYSIDLSSADQEKSFRIHAIAFRRILDRCVVAYTPTIENDPPGDFQPEEFHTPNVKTIAEVAAFTGLPEASQIKTLVMVADSKPVLALVRGDHQLDNAKLAAATAALEIRAARPEEIREWLGTDPGSLGPVGVDNLPIFADEALFGRRNMICGANRNDFHLRHVTPSEDFTAQFVSLAREDESATEIYRSARLSPQPFEPRVTDENGDDIVASLGRHTLLLDRLLFAAAEQNQDKDGLILPSSIAPFDVVVTPVFYADESQRRAASDICAATESAGLAVLLDDRDERPGVKFKDADLIGIPLRINIGKKLGQGLVELVERSSRQVSEVPVAHCISHLSGLR